MIRFTRPFFYIALLAVLMSSGTSVAYARKVRTSHKVAKVSVQSVMESSDSLTFAVRADTTPEWSALAGRIRFSGYDKTPSSNKESFFITNCTDSVMMGLSVGLEYRDLNGRILHERTVEIDCDIPASDTRRVDIATWDLQHAFRHYRCPATRRPTTPFKVTITPKTITFGK